MPFSMTGFGAAEGPVGSGRLRVEIRTVNHRFFNPSFKLPAEFQGLEALLRDRLRADFERGHVTVYVRWATGAAEAGSLQLNLERAREAMARLRELQGAVGLKGEIPLDLLARQPEVLAVAATPATPLGWAEVEPLVAEAGAACLAMRRREGEVLAADLRFRLEQLSRLAALIQNRAPERRQREQDRLRASVAELLDGRTVNEDRIAMEIALAADRLDITEELVRLEAHLAAAQTGLAEPKSVGKQLGFLAQEMGREVNTIGAKANDAMIGHWVVEMKGELEKFREQVENLE